MKNLNVTLNFLSKIIAVSLLVMTYSCSELQQGEQLSISDDLAGSKYAALSPSILDQAFCSECPEPKMSDLAYSGSKPLMVQKKQSVKIYPTGEYPTDLLNVQAAVEGFGQQGIDGTIVLKSRNKAGEPTSFIFGGASRLLVWGSSAGQSGGLDFVGERDGAAMTTIIGSNLYRTIWFLDREGDFRACLNLVFLLI